jgi:uncharacterized protein YehS (DUF1456 family)
LSWFLAPPDLLSRCLTCLAIARLGRNENNLSLTVQAQALNTAVLRKLQTALNDRSDTLAACLAIAMDEVRPAAYIGRWL